MLQTINARLIGDTFLIMHNIQLADPLSEASQAIREVTSKRKKTESDIEEIRRLEWLGGLYLDHEGRVAIPADNVIALVIEGARKSKLGKDAQAGVFETQPYYPLEYDGPKDLGALYKSGAHVYYRSVRVQRNRIMRSRPRFPKWSLPISLHVNTDVIDVKHVWDALEIAGERIGLGDYRPRFGRFTVEGRNGR